MRLMAWHPAADVADLADREVIGREVAGRSVALYRLDGAYFATADLCTHALARLSDGEVVEGYIECPAHHALFEIRTGKATGGRATCDLATYPVRVEGTRIEVEIGP